MSLLNRFARQSQLVLAGLIAVCVLVWPTSVVAKPLSFTLDVTPKRVSIDEVITVTIRVEVSGVGGPERYWKPAFRNFEVLDARVHPGQYLSSDSGKPTLISSRLYVYQLRAKRSGRLSIEPARVRIRGRDYKTYSASIVVRRSKGPTTDLGVVDPLIASGNTAPGFVPPDVNGTPPLFIHVVADNLQPYVGQQVTVSWLLYSTTDILKYEPETPRFDNLWSELLTETGSRFRYIDTKVNGRHYYVVSLVKRALFPTRSGLVTIPALVANIAVPLSRLSSRIKSPPVELVVKPLPPHSPPGFDPSYVGVFELEAALDRTSLQADQPLILTLTIRGDGAIRRTSPPLLEFSGFDFRAPRDYDESIDTSTNIVRGERTYRYWATPKKGGPQLLPAVTVPFFNPRTEQYEFARSEPLSIVVRGEPTPTTPSSERDRASDRDIRVIAEGGEGSILSSRGAQLYYRRWWFWLLMVLPGISFLGIVGIDWFRRRMRRETPRARLRRARGKAKQRFRLAEIHLRGNRPAKFFGELAHVIYETLEEQLEQPVQSLTRDELQQTLRERGFAASTIRRITADLDVFDMARFAPSAIASDDMRSALRRVKTLLREIERTAVVSDASDNEDRTHG